MAFDDALYCEEQEDSGVTFNFNSTDADSDLMWDDEELHTLFSKEKESFVGTVICCDDDLSFPRKETVEWILRINSHYGFSASTAILCVNYLDRFTCSLSFQRDKPWMMQLTAVASLSLAAKLQETYVPLLLDFQVEGAKYVFEAKTIQKMELLILSTLEWRMSSVTPLSFIDHSMRRLGLVNTNLRWEFLRRCENLLLLAISDSRFRWFPPSVLAGATMIYVIQEAASEQVDYEVELLSMLKISKEEVYRCYHFLSDKSSNTWRVNVSLKRKRDDDDSDDEELSSSISSPCSSSPSPDSMHHKFFKRNRVEEQQQMKRMIPLLAPTVCSSK